MLKVVKIYENLSDEVRKRVYGQITTTTKLTTTKLATTESQIATGGDLTFSLCVACRVGVSV